MVILLFKYHVLYGMLWLTLLMFLLMAKYDLKLKNDGGKIKAY
jgi:hypothetical protein